VKLFHTGHPAMLHNEQDRVLVLQPADAKDENLGLEILPAWDSPLSSLPQGAKGVDC